VSFSLKGLAFPKLAGEQYVILSIDELNDEQLQSTRVAANRSYAIAFFDTSLLAAGTVKPMKSSDLTFTRSSIAYNPVIGKLNTLTIHFYKPDGTIVTPADCGGVETCALLVEVVVLSGRMY
jgi:hypothetical protein